jgi:glycosyltransferase involved in cell wall biosynthesis
MLGEYFTHQKFKHFIKSLYWSLTDFHVLRDANAVLFTCEEEKRFARYSFRRYSANEEVAPLGLTTPEISREIRRENFYCRYPDLKTKRLILFLGRLVPIKGCDLLIEAFAQVAFRDPGLQLVMAGPDQDGWQQQLMQQASHLGIAERITWTGMLDTDARWAAICAAEVMAMPSHHENFSYSTVEGLACGVPALLTNKVGIWREIELAGAGLIGSHSVAGFAQLLNDWLNMNQTKKKLMRERSEICFRQHFEIDQAVKHVIDIIQRNSNPAISTHDYRGTYSRSL